MTISSVKLISRLFGALTRFEPNLIRMQAQAGLQVARAKGKKRDRRQKLTPQEIEIRRSPLAVSKRSLTSICEHLGINELVFTYQVE
jgi:DNA invertase Pin-like site-specific DNA recombinase